MLLPLYETSSKPLYCDVPLTKRALSCTAKDNESKKIKLTVYLNTTKEKKLKRSNNLHSLTSTLKIILKIEICFSFCHRQSFISQGVTASEWTLRVGCVFLERCGVLFLENFR